MSIIYKQSNDYNCGTTALAQLLSLSGYQEYTPEAIEDCITPHPETGTSHLQLCEFLRYEGFSYQHGTPDIYTLRLPMLVNYSPDGEGHYGVVTRMNFNSEQVRLLDPADGRAVNLPIRKFLSIWYSSRYGKEWGLWDLRKV